RWPRRLALQAMNDFARKVVAQAGKLARRCGVPSLLGGDKVRVRGRNVAHAPQRSAAFTPLQCPNRSVHPNLCQTFVPMDFCVWCFSGAWSLGFGAFTFLALAFLAAGLRASAAGFPPPAEHDFTIHDFHFRSGQTLPESRIQYRLLTEGLNVNHLRLVMGTSMGGMHAWLWGEMYPSYMDALMPLASLPTQISGRNRVWRRTIIDSIRGSPGWQNGDYAAQPY